MFYVQLHEDCERIKKEIRNLLVDGRYKSKDVYIALDELAQEYFLQDNSANRKTPFSEIPVVNEDGLCIYGDGKLLTVEDFIEKNS